MKFIIGVDEVGWGALAGPLCTGAVAVPVGWTLPGLTDSKALSPRKRQQLLQTWRAEYSWPQAVVFVSPAGFDRMKPAEALKSALKTAATSVLDRCRQKNLTVERVIFDGTRNFSVGVPSTAEPKADRNYPAVSMASVLAKETRDLFMHVLAPLPLYRPYDFLSNAGYYGSPQHAEMIKKLGPSPMHRHSYLTKLTM